MTLVFQLNYAKCCSRTLGSHITHNSNVCSTVLIRIRSCNLYVVFTRYDVCVNKVSLRFKSGITQVMVKIKVESCIVGPTSYPTHIPLVPCQSATPILRYGFLKIWQWKSKFNVMGAVKIQGHIVVPTTNQLIFLSFRVNRPALEYIFFKM